MKDKIAQFELRKSRMENKIRELRAYIDNEVAKTKKDLLNKIKV